MNYVISAEHNGKTILEYLKKVLVLSRAEITSLKNKENGILLNGGHMTVRAVLSENDVLSLARADTEEAQNKNIVPRNIPIDILYEDDDMIAVNKPYGMPTHPSHGHFDDTLANALSFYFAEKGIPFVFRAVNRLDRDTSGIVLVAKNRSAAFKLSIQLSKGLAEKEYIAVAEGFISENGCIKAFIKRKHESIIERTVCPPTEGQYAETCYMPLASNKKATLLSVAPKTGRTHQIRVHLSHIGHPICGDTLYGNPDDSPLISRQALHCLKLTVRRIDSGEPITLTAPLHDDMKKLSDMIYDENLLVKT